MTMELEDAQAVAIVFERDGRFFVSAHGPIRRFAASPTDVSDRDLGVLVLRALARHRNSKESTDSSGASVEGDDLLRPLPEVAGVTSMKAFLPNARMVVVGNLDGHIIEIAAFDRTRDPNDWVGTSRYVALDAPVYPDVLGAAVRQTLELSNRTDLRSRLSRLRRTIREWGPRI
jgi:hypothetical protein